MKTYGGLETKLQAVVTSLLGGGKLFASSFDRFTPGGRVRLTAGLDAWPTETSLPLPEIEPRS